MIRTAAFRLCSRPRRRRWIWSRKRLTSARRTVPLCVGENRIFAASVRVRVCACVCVCVRVGEPAWSSVGLQVRRLGAQPATAHHARSRRRGLTQATGVSTKPTVGSTPCWAHPAYSRTRAPARYHAQGMCFTLCAGADVSAGSRHRRADTAVGGEWPAAFVTLFGTHHLRLSAAHQCVGARR